jgi:hypothetical protein
MIKNAFYQSYDAIRNDFYSELFPFRGEYNVIINDIRYRGIYIPRALEGKKIYRVKNIPNAQTQKWGSKCEIRVGYYVE